MANIIMHHLEGSNYEPLYPKTLGAITIASDEVAEAVGLSSGANVDAVLKELSKLIYTYGTEDLKEGESTLLPGRLHFVYEE